MPQLNRLFRKNIGIGSERCVNIDYSIWLIGKITYFHYGHSWNLLPVRSCRCLVRLVTMFSLGTQKGNGQIFSSYCGITTSENLPPSIYLAPWFTSKDPLSHLDVNASTKGIKMNIFQNLLPKSLDFPRPNPTSLHSCAVSWRSWKGPPRCVAAPGRNVRRSLGRRSTLSPWTLRHSPTWRKRTYPNDPMYLLWLAAERCHPSILLYPTFLDLLPSDELWFWTSTHHNKSLGTDNATERGDQMPCCGESMAKLSIFCLWCRTNMWMKPKMPNAQLTRVPGMMLMTNTTNYFQMLNQMTWRFISDQGSQMNMFQNMLLEGYQNKPRHTDLYMWAFSSWMASTWPW